MTRAELIAALETAQGADKSDAYRWGWDWAALRMELHHWMLPHLGTTQWEDAQRGFDDYHAAACLRAGGE